ncbi:MAG TPA: hypothetical protein VM140_12330 [Burkholderiales bacterium]|nr:hypothetical protein [Burkholderiales bacterium]
MISLVAPTVLRLAPDQVAGRARERFGGELRRAGGFAQLCLLGAQACLDAAPAGGSLGVLWASNHGARAAARTALRETASGEPVMPFSFVATQPHLAATLLAQRSARVARAAFVHIDPAGWPRLLSLAQVWLANCEQVLVGWVEEAADAEAHQSDWCVVQKKPGEISCEPLRDARGALPATSADWLTRVAAWLAAPREPLALRGGGEAWRFAAVR